MGKTKTSKSNLATSGAPLSEEEFKIMIKEAEKGPFYSIQETTLIIDKWKSKYAF
ncbi:hypothetical protein [Dyadobacter pollutisoli]|jgi:hypothetical protein|uniref:Uncharacterized protein n=1 Tax=Dyadobacter pollutisoli TaxID=2910158 RepID=A0A9E8SJC3_9BACT|nr:hypothetical protein [Dyadobacter pollutisoli]WAC10728.1 hypothetical protein ON006_23665 [Dyadobacter pollutisoli]